VKSTLSCYPRQQVSEMRHSLLVYKYLDLYDSFPIHLKRIYLSALDQCACQIGQNCLIINGKLFLLTSVR